MAAWTRGAVVGAGGEWALSGWRSGGVPGVWYFALTLPHEELRGSRWLPILDPIFPALLGPYFTQRKIFL